MSLYQVVYASQLSRHDEATLNTILADARRRNVEDDITGALICRTDIYLQLLEGPISKVKAAYTRINRDDRHHSIRELVSGPIGSRLFPGGRCVMIRRGHGFGRPARSPKARWSVPAEPISWRSLNGSRTIRSAPTAPADFNETRGVVLASVSAAGSACALKEGATNPGRPIRWR